MSTNLQFNEESYKVESLYKEESLYKATSDLLEYAELDITEKSYRAIEGIIASLGLKFSVESIANEFLDNLMTMRKQFVLSHFLEHEQLFQLLLDTKLINELEIHDVFDVVFQEHNIQQWNLKALSKNSVILNFIQKDWNLMILLVDSLTEKDQVMKQSFQDMIERQYPDAERLLDLAQTTQYLKNSDYHPRDKHKLFELCKENDTIRARLDTVFENQLENTFEDIEKLLKYLNKQTKKCRLNI